MKKHFFFFLFFLRNANCDPQKNGGRFSLFGIFFIACLFARAPHFLPCFKKSVGTESFNFGEVVQKKTKNGAVFAGKKKEKNCLLMI